MKHLVLPKALIINSKCFSVNQCIVSKYFKLFKKMNLVIWVQILDKAVCISLCINILEKGMSPFVFRQWWVNCKADLALLPCRLANQSRTIQNQKYRGSNSIFWKHIFYWKLSTITDMVRLQLYTSPGVSHLYYWRESANLYSSRCLTESQQDSNYQLFKYLIVCCIN